MFAASTLLHTSLALNFYKKEFAVIDYCTIYLHLAGTYTPITLIALHGQLGLNLFTIIWILSGLGFLYKFYFFDKFPALSNLSYIVIGWNGIFFWQQIVDKIGYEGFQWLFASGLCVTIGFIFFNLTKLRFHHGVWHLFVLAASFCYFITISRFIAPV